MRVLIVEDEIKTANYLKNGLTENGFVVDIANNGMDGLFFATNHEYDVVILDVMLPKLDGWTVIKKLRSTHKDCAVLFLTARDDVADRVKGLELGADDYLVKPFAFSELLARIRSLVRRGTVKHADVEEIADLEVDFIHHKVSRNGQRLDLTAKEFALLSLFVRKKGELLSRTYIAEQLWDMNFDSDTNVVEVAIKRLRQKMYDPYPQKLIHTVRGVGYVLEER